MSSSTDNTYFAALPPDDLAQALIGKIETYYKYLEDTGMMRKLRKSYEMYFGYSNKGYFQSTSDVGVSGEQGELSIVKINHYRNLLQHMLVMTTNQRPALEARASNTDVTSTTQTVLANSILDYYMRDKRLERYLKTATEHCLYLSEGYVHVEWDPDLGQPIAVNPETNSPVKEGDLKFSCPLGPFEVVKDPYVTSPDQNCWYMPWRLINKWDLAALYPEKADDIISKSNPSADRQTYQASLPNYRNDSDLIPIYTFYHKPSPAMPAGRMFVFLSGDTWLFDGDNPYTALPGGMPIYRISPADFHGASNGYTPCWDIIGLSEVIDALYSTVVTNQTAFGVQNILVPKGHDLGFQQLAGGLNVLEYDPDLQGGGKPEPLNLTHTPAEIFNFIEKLENTSQILLGINNVVRGQPEASLDSGAALALVASQAIQFNSGLQMSYTALLEDVGTATIKMLQTFANTKRVASIAGKSQQYMLKEFSSSDLSEINRVTVDVANPLSRTISGRLQIAEQLIKAPGTGPLINAEQYMQVIETGRLQPIVEGPQKELISIREENEYLSNGQTVRAVATDSHRLHIREHKVVLASIDARQDVNLVNATLAHIEEHLNILRSADPLLLAVIGEQPAAPLPGQGGPPQQPPPGPGPGPGPGGPHGPPPPQHGAAPNASAISDPTSPTSKEAQGVHQANMPKNPLTNERYNNSDGGLPPQGA